MDATEFKAKREQYGLTQGQLAGRLGVTTTTVYRWEAGHVAAPAWLRSWFAGEFGEDRVKVWRAIRTSWYGRPFNVLPGVYNSAAEAEAAALKGAAGDRWHFQCPSAAVICVERE